MNIECDKCKTRFRFDDALMEKGGVWLRCSRCQNVFFYENPTESVVASSVVNGPQQGEDEAFRERSFRDWTPHQTDGASESIEHDDRVTPPIEIADSEPQVVLPGKTILDEIEKDIVSGHADDMSKEGLHPAEDEEDDEGESESVLGQPYRKEGRFTWKLVLLVLLINLIIGGGLYLFFFPDIGEQALSSIRSIPVVQYIFGAEKQPGDVNPGLLKIKEVTNRYVNSSFSNGIPLLVVEGKVVNKSQEILTRIRIQGKLYDGTNRILQMRVSYCGNMLSDEELGGLQESEIQRRLSTPQDANITKDKLLPNHEIPFMLVFALDKAGVDKRSPVVAGAVPMAAERLLN
jgi:predicted Zn finger-like uncharacterized protein